jgi:hypothetical protein
VPNAFLANRENAPEPHGLPSGVDHLVYGAPELEAGMAEMERLLGVCPVPGGRHPDFGTHNALLGLGPETYLEVIAPDPSLPPPARGVLFGADALEAPRLVAWALRVEAIEERAADAAARGLSLGAVQSGSRETPGGRVLSWKLTDPYAMLLDGAIPFLIAWGKTPHPGRGVPRAGELMGLRLEHPDAGALRQCLEALGVEVGVREAPRPGVIAMIRTQRGLVEIR